MTIKERKESQRLRKGNYYTFDTNIHHKRKTTYCICDPTIANKYYKENLAKTTFRSVIMDFEKLEKKTKKEIIKEFEKLRRRN